MKKRSTSSPQLSRNSPSPVPFSSVDPKLLHLVRKLVASTDTTASLPSADYVVNYLRTQHREYQRKDTTWIKRNVEKALKEEILTRNAVATTKEPQLRRLSKKAKLDNEEELSTTVETAEERQHEQLAQEHDRIREELAEKKGSGSMLNANLRNRYKEVQQGRDTIARTAAVVTVQEEDDDEEDIALGNAEAKLVGEEAAGKISAPPSPAKQTSASPSPAKSIKKVRRKKSALNRSSSAISDNNGLPPIPGAAGGTDFATPVPRPRERYKDLGGMAEILQQIRQLIEYPLVRPELYKHLGVDPPRGVLLRGPPGCGKTHLANAIAGQLGLPYFRVSAPELVSSMSGESEGRIRDLFKAASDAAPSLMFMDELDAIAPKRSESSGGRGMEKRMVAQLLTSLDSIDPQYNRKNAPVLVLGATNRPDAMDPALRRAGRFDKEIVLGVPDEAAREGIIRTMTQSMRLSGDFDFKILARKTPGFVGADVRSLTREASVLAINRIFSDVLIDQQLPSDSIIAPSKEPPEIPADGNEAEKGDSKDMFSIATLTTEQMEPLFITMPDFLQAIPLVQPSSKREGFATVPDVSWDDIGALHSVREELSLSVLEPIRHPEKFQALGLPLPAGVMLYGPPGCGKTLLAKAIANESGANFISVKGPELLDKYVGESERAVRVVFERARSSSPCIVFFDELDSLCPKRGSDGGGGGGVSERVVNQLLTEMDGLDSRRSVFVIAATNRPELIDPAMMRPGRLDKLLYVPLPEPDDRVSILKAVAVKIKLGPDVSLDEIGRSPRAEGYSGADCVALLRESGLAVLKESQNQEAATPLHITARHFQYAFDHVMPSVSRKDQARYDRMRQRMARARSRGGVADAGNTGGQTEDTPTATEPAASDGQAAS